MKKLIVTLLLILSSSLFTFCLAQFNRYFPIPDSNACWVETDWFSDETCSNFGEWYNFFSYYTNGDTVVAGKTYIKVRVSGGYSYVTYCADTNRLDYDTLACLLRNDTATKKVYASYQPNFGLDTLLYDFSLQTGDYLPPSYSIIWGRLSPNDSLFVYSIDSILIGSTYRKQFIIAEPKSNPYLIDSIIEGIGSAMGLLEQIEDEGNNRGSNLLCFSDSSISITYPTGIYPGPPCKRFYLATPAIQKPEAVVSIYPNPNSGSFIVSLPTINETYSLQIYNTLGQQIYSQIPIFSRRIAGQFSIDLSSQPNGVYFYRVVGLDGGLIGSGKLVVQR